MARTNPIQVVHRLRDALNAHDIDAFVDCFSPEYRSEQPVHPNRAFGGYDQVRKNWTQMFSEIPDIHADLIETAGDANTVWAEWHWKGTHADGSLFAMKGVTIMGTEEGRIAWARLYMEPVEEESADIDQAVQDLTRGKG